MAFYDLSKVERLKLVNEIAYNLKNAVSYGKKEYLLQYFSDPDTYIRKNAYLSLGQLYRQEKKLRPNILSALKLLLNSKTASIRQTAVNTAGEIGMTDFDVVREFFDSALLDTHHSVRNAVIGSIKKMGAKNPRAILDWAQIYLNHPDAEIRREICHGLELRGRTHPQDILPFLKQLQNERSSRVRNTLIHVLGQIAYKKGCLATVVMALNSWENLELVEKALDEVVDVHERYKSFAAMSQQQAIDYIDHHYKK